MSLRRMSFLIVLATFLGGCQQMKPMGEFGQRIIDLATGKTPRVAAVKMEDQYFPDERRQGINQLVDREFGRHPPYVERYMQIAQTDPDYLVRATAIRALNRARYREATPVFVRALEDPNELVRLEAVKALINMPDQTATPTLLKMVTNPNESKDVRIATADALKHYRKLEVARSLIAQLGGRDFGIAWQSHKSLVVLTGKDLRYDESAWLTLLTGPQSPLG